MFILMFKLEGLKITKLEGLKIENNYRVGGQDWCDFLLFKPKC
jgi:hypothetical protein